MTNPTLFLDRDGTIIRDKDYLADPEKVELLPGAAAGLKSLAARGFQLVVVTNQSGVGRGFFSEEAVRRVNHRVRALLAAEGVDLTGEYYCPHAPEDGCDCRKPKPGMALRAADELNLSLAGAVVIGDKPSDLGLARAIGADAILVRTGYGAEYERAGHGDADTIVDDLRGAAEWILSRRVENRPPA